VSETGATADASGDTIGRNALFAFVTQATTALFTAVLTLYLARELGPEGFGIFSLALGLTGLLLKPAELGTTQAAARYVAERHGDNEAVAGVLALALPIRTATATTIAVALFALAEPIADAYNEPDLVWPLRGMAIAFVGQSLLLFCRSMFTALRRTSSTFKLVLSESAVEFAASVSLVAIGTGVTGAAFGRAIGYVFGAILGIFLLTRLLGHFPVGRGRRSPVARSEFMKYSAAMLVVQGAAAAFAQIDVILLGAFLSASSVGLFTAPLRLTSIVAYPAAALAQGVAPRMARHVTDTPRGDAMLAALRYMVIFQTGVVVALVVWADPIVDLALGDEFAESADIMRGLAPVIFLAGLNPLFVSPLNYAGEGRRRIPNSIGALLLNAALDIVLIPWIGIYGAVVGSAAAYAVYVGYNAWLCREVLGVPLGVLVPTALRTLAAAVVLAGILAAFGTTSLTTLEWIGGIFLGAGAFVAVLILTRELTAGELRTIVTAPIRAARR
jgi:O-antigen/teichoic acid export membrane protein